MTIININHLSKSYGDVHAVRDISLEVHQGEIFGFLGLNGAGKTTTIRTMLGMIKPTSGNVSLIGETIQPGKGPWADVGYLVESPAAYPNLSVRENLEIARRLHGIKEDHSVSDMIEKLGIQDYANRKASTLSTGNLQRLGLARAMLHNPRLLILDEPANGLDPAGVIEVRNLLQELAAEGVTIFMSSHILSEVDRLATHICIIHQGKLLEHLGMDQLERFRQKHLEICVNDQQHAVKVLENAGYSVIQNGKPGQILLQDTRAIKFPEEVAQLLVQADIGLTHLAVEQQNLEDHFMQLTGAER